MAYAHINAVMAGAHNVEDQGMACCMPSWLTDGYPYSSWSRRKGHTYKYSRAEARGFLQKRIAAVVPRWISSADVRAIIPINEAIANQPYTGRGGWPHTWITGAQENIFSWAFGDSTHNSTEWFGQTFKWVRAAADGAGATKLNLLYNDYGIITPGAKQDAVLRLLTEQKAAGVPIDGIGFQSHLPCDCTGAAGCNSSAVIAASMRRFIKAGFTVAVTELDVSTDGMDPESLCTPAMQAAVYGAVLEACLSVSPHCESVMVWGFTDHIYSPGQWLAGKQPAIFDGDFHAKESYFAMQKILAAKTPGPRPPPPPPSAGKKYACVVAGPGEDVCMEAGPGTVGVPLAQCKATCKVAAKTSLPEAETIAPPFPTNGPAENLNKVKYFSWYSYTGCQVPGCPRNMSASAGAAYRNLAMDGDLTYLSKTYQQFSVPGMLYLQNSIKGCNHTRVYDYSPAKNGLAPGWEAAVDDCIKTLIPLAKGNGGHIHGVQLGDELVLGSIPHFSLANLTALAARFHDGLHPHDVFIFTNEGGGAEVPAWPVRS